MQAWLTWCESINEHASIGDIWRKLNLAAGKLGSSLATPNHRKKPMTLFSLSRITVIPLNYMHILSTV